MGYVLGGFVQGGLCPRGFLERGVLESFFGGKVGFGKGAYVLLPTSTYRARLW